MHNKRPNRYSLIIALSVGLLLLSACGSSFKGEAVKPLKTAPDIVLSDQEGNPFQLSQHKGQIVLVFFGYTNCVDECPATLAHIKLALGQLGTAADQVRVVFVSTDPIRDGRHALHEFLMKFDPGYVGLTGQFSDMQPIWDAYGVTVLDGGITHSSYIYVVDQQGDLRLRFPIDTTPEDMASDLKTFLGSGSN